MKRIRILALCLVGFSVVVSAETVYRSVDAEGNVTFSSQPLQDAKEVEQVEIAPGPSEESQKEAMQRQQRLIDLAAGARKEREEKEEARRSKVEDAEQSVKDAEQALKDAKVITPDDRRGGAGSGMIAPGYNDRVKQAEDQLAEAKRELSKARSGQ